MSPFWTLFYTPAIVAAWPTTLMLTTWANYAALMNKPVARRRVTTQSSYKDVITLRPAVARSAYVAKMISSDSKRPDNVVSLADKHRKRKASKGLS